MAESRIVDFNALPRAVRERLIGCLQRSSSPEPILADVSSYGGAIAGWVILALTGGAIALGTASASFGRQVQTSGAIAGYALGIAGVILGVLGIVRRVKQERGLPFKAGRYLFPMDFIDARDRMIRLIPMNALIDFRGVHQHTNGVYNGTTLTFTFEGGVTESFVVRGKELAERVLMNLRESQALIRRSVESKDIETIFALDPFLEVRIEEGGWAKRAPANPKDVDGPAAQSLGGIFRRPVMFAASAALGLAVAVPMFFVRNLLSDEAMFQAAVNASTEWSFEEYLFTGKRHADEVKSSLLPRAALKAAQQKGTVTALHEFLDKYPKSCVDDEAHKSIHELFTKTLADFRDQSSNSDPRLMPFMEKLVGYLEAHDSSRVEARFHSPSSAALEVVDTLLRSKVGGAAGIGKVVPVAPHFDDTHSIPRESNIVKSLQAGFSAIFPADIMTIDAGKRIMVQTMSAADALPKKPAPKGAAKAKPAAEDPPKPAVSTLGAIDVPTLEVQYRVGWAGDIYSEEKGDRQFVGIVVNFDVSMRIPDSPDSFDFSLEVTPPDHFSVEYSSPFGGSYGLPGLNQPSEGQVYDVMAARAFDQLTAKLRAVFFKPGSKAFEGAPEADDPEDGPKPKGLPKLPEPPRRRGTQL